MQHRMSTSTAATWICCIVMGLVASYPLTGAAEGGLPKTEGWIEVKTRNFTLYSNAGIGSTRKIAVQLERFRQALGRITRGFELSSDVPTLTFVFKNDAAYVPYKQKDGETMNVSGYFQPRPFRNYITLDSSAGAQPLRVVYHEFFHSVMNNTLGSLPVWLSEGMAEYFSTFKDRDGSASVEVGHPIEGHLYHLGQFGLIDWNEFFATTRDSPTYNEGTRQGSFYAQAWLLTHYLNAEDARSKQLGKYLGLLRAGEDEDEAFVAAFGKPKPAVGAEVERYGKSGSGYVWWDFGEEHGDVEVAMRELEPGEVLFRLGELLAQRGQPEAAREHLSRARSEGWAEAPICTATGVASLYSGDETAAEFALRKAVEAGDTSAEPYILLGDLLMERFLETPESERYNKQTPALVAEARGLFERGLVLQPAHVKTLLSLSRTYVFGGPDTTPGVQAIARARSICPLDPYMLQIQASLLARDGHVGKACEIIEREIRPKDDKLATHTTRLVGSAVTIVAMERLEADDRAGAAEILAAAVEHLPDARIVEQLRQLHEVVVSGGSLYVDEGNEQESAEPSPAKQAIAEYNEGIRLANARRYEEALAKFENLAEECVDEELCAKARSDADDLRAMIARNRYVEKYNSAVDQSNEGDLKGAVDTLRQLEATTDDPEKLKDVQDFLRRLGARVSKKKD